MSAEQLVDSLFVAAGKAFQSEELTMDADGKQPENRFLHMGHPTRAWEFVAVSKSELTGSDEVRDRLAAELGTEVESLSAVTGQGLARLMGRVVPALDALPREELHPVKPFAEPAPAATNAPE